MKKTILMAIVMGAMGVAGTVSAAEQASATFTWAGTVPMGPTSNGFIIKDSVGNDIQRGSLVFSVDAAGKGALTSSSTLGFNVFDYTNEIVGAPASTSSYQGRVAAGARCSGILCDYGRWCQNGSQWSPNR